MLENTILTCARTNEIINMRNPCTVGPCLSVVPVCPSRQRFDLLRIETVYLHGMPPLSRRIAVGRFELTQRYKLRGKLSSAQLRTPTDIHNQRQSRKCLRDRDLLNR